MRLPVLVFPLALLPFPAAAQEAAPSAAPAMASAPAAPNLSARDIDALFAGCERGRVDVVQRVLDSGVPIDIVAGRYKSTPLITASSKSIEVVRYLLSRGANVNLTDGSGYTALNMACFWDKPDVVLALLEAKADPNLGTKGDGRAPLMNAARCGDEAIVAALLKAGADPNAYGSEGPPIWWAVGRNHPGCIKLLGDAGAKMNFKWQGPAPAQKRYDLLQCAANHNRIDMIDLILSYGGDINAVSENGLTPLLRAILFANEETVRHLIAKGADVKLAGASGNTPLHEAILCQDVPVWQDLLDHGADVNARNGAGETPLIRAVRVVGPIPNQFLLDHGAQVDIADNRGATALAYATEQGDLDMIALLKARGAKPVEPRIIPKEEETPPLPPASRWALAVAAVYTQQNGASHGKLGVDNRNETDAADGLKDMWGVTDKDSLLKAIDDLRTKGQHAESQQLGASLAAMSDAEFAAALKTVPPDQIGQTKALRQSQQKWKEKSALAWDLCRAANLVNWGYQAGYINQTEAWNLLMPIAQQTQQAFSSWQEMSDNFLDGRAIWNAGDRSPQVEAVSRLLLNPGDSNSPWNQCPWKTDLTPAASIPSADPGKGT